MAPTLVLQIPSTVIYLGVYDHLRERLKTTLQPQHQWLGPTFSGMAARTLAATVVAPLELVRTRRQAAQVWPHPTLFAALREIAKQEGPATFLRGIAPTLLRDVPFSGMYWWGVESISEKLHRRLGPPVDRRAQVYQEWLIGLVAGCTSGGVAALVTTPFDVIKTRQQVVHIPKPGTKGPADGCFTKAACNRIAILSVARTMWRTEGVSAFFVGVVPRVTKVGPSCAIMYSTFVMMKTMFSLGVV